MTTIANAIRNIKDSLRHAKIMVEDLHLGAPDLQELKNAANQATQAAQELNRLVGRMEAASMDHPGKPY